VMQGLVVCVVAVTRPLGSTVSLSYRDDEQLTTFSGNSARAISVCVFWRSARVNDSGRIFFRHCLMRSVPMLCYSLLVLTNQNINIYLPYLQHDKYDL
jgi:hypothetical protein